MALAVPNTCHPQGPFDTRSTRGIHGSRDTRGTCVNSMVLVTIFLLKTFMVLVSFMDFMILVVLVTLVIGTRD